jgi:hypothetical protein
MGPSSRQQPIARTIRARRYVVHDPTNPMVAFHKRDFLKTMESRFVESVALNEPFAERN